MFNRTFGVEIEAYNCTQTQVATAFQQAVINAEVQSYNHSTQPCWKVITDGSISGTNGFAVVSPILQGEEGLRQVRVVMEALTSIGAKVNKTLSRDTCESLSYGYQSLTQRGFRHSTQNIAYLAG